MPYSEAPEYKPFFGKSIFLAGGITSCPDWQALASDAIQHYAPDVMVYNPRRANFPMDDPTAAREQIEWEHNMLLISTVVMFWFPKSEVMQPISLFELGKHFDRRSESGEIVVGASPEYPRYEDIKIQLELEHPNFPVYTTLNDTVMRTLDMVS